MPIVSALPESTVRLLGSGITITTPCDLVKELIENAIDARATSIKVGISSDSLSHIIVRDDGHGIDVDDFDSLGRRSHTSKLKSFDELKTRGRETLGFRGEALASANSIATISITTRTKTDPVASLMGLRSGVGGIENLRKVSAPVGTIVQVSKLFENLPARKQYALKNGNKSISKINDLVKTYALARPSLKFSLKVFEGGLRGACKSTWSYKPNHSPTVHEAVLQIFRRDLASNCVQVSRQLGPEMSVPLHVKSPPAITVDAFIPAPGCNDKLVRGKGAHISVDSRPLSPTRGLPKKIVAMFKSHLGDAMRSRGLSSSLTNPFIQLNIVCPPCSYDPNVTPPKDEVVFADESRLLECFDSMFRKFYQVENLTDGGRNETLNQKMMSRGSLHSHVQLPCSTTDTERVPSCKDPDDQTLDKERNRCLVPVKKSSLPEEVAREARPAQASEDSSGLSQEGPRRSPLQSAQMRLNKAVNMARTKSDISDDTALGKTLPVEIAPLLPIQKPDPSNSKPRVNLKKPVSKLTLENIEQYFWPSRNKDFQIAEDQTATQGKQLAEQSIPSQGETERRPLQELGDSAINEIQGLEGLGADFVNVRTEGSQPRQAMRVNTRVPLPVRGPRTTGNREVARVFQGTPPNSGPQSREQRLNDVASPRVVANVHGIRTPPSDPPVGNRNPNPPFQPHRRSAALQRHNRDLGGSRFSMDSPIPSRISLGQMANRSSMPEQSIFSRATRDPFSTNIEAPFNAVPSLAIPRPQRMNVELSSALSAFPMTSQDSRSSRDQMAWNVTRRNQPHPLIPEPVPERNTPFDSIKRKADNASWMDNPAWYEPEEIASQAPPRFDQECHRNPASEAEAALGPGHYPNKRLCSRPRNTSLSRNSLSFGLGMTEDAMKMQAVSTELKLGQGEIRRWEQMLSRWEPYIISGKSEAPLPFRTMEEVRTIELGLRETVNTWMKKTNQEFTVEYTLHSTAKGKRAKYM